MWTRMRWKRLKTLIKTRICKRLQSQGGFAIATLPRMWEACGQIAQLVEQGIENPRVGGSIPSLATIPRSWYAHP